MSWSQLYDPFDNRVLSTAVSALPVVTLFFVLVALKKRVWVAALSGFIVAVTLALFVFGIPPVRGTTGGARGVFLGLLRIAGLVGVSFFLYTGPGEPGGWGVMRAS